MPTLIKDMLFIRRQFIIDEVKAPIQKALEALNNQRTNFLNRVRMILAVIKLAKRYPEPTKENLIFRNSQIRLEIKEELLEHLDNPGRAPLLNAAFRILIDECEHDGFYEFLHDYYIVGLLKRGWQPAKRGFPMWRYWDGPLPTDYVQESSPDWLDRFMVYLEEWDYPNKGKYQRLRERIKEKELVNK